MELNPTTLEAYNKSITKGQGTLIGNWKEERDLREATGISRTSTNGQGQTGQITRTGRSSSCYSNLSASTQPKLTPSWLDEAASSASTSFNKTSERCFGQKYNHIPRTVNSEYGKGFNKADGFARVGLNHIRNEKLMLELIQQELNEKENIDFLQRNARNFQTTSQTQYGPKNHAILDNVLGRRVMKTQNGNQIAPSRRDEDLLVDHGFLPRPQFLTDNELKRKLLNSQGESYLQQQHITLWTEKSVDGFGCVYKSQPSHADPKSSFRINNQFVKTFHDYSHIRK